MNTFFNTEITSYTQKTIGMTEVSVETSLLMVAGDIFLAPVQYLCRGRKYNVVNSEVSHEGLRFTNTRWYLLVLAVVAFIPSIVIGGLIKGASLCFEEGRRNFKLVHAYTKSADKFWHVAKSEIIPRIDFPGLFKTARLKNIMPKEKLENSHGVPYKDQKLKDKILDYEIDANNFPHILKTVDPVLTSDIEQSKKHADILTKQLILNFKGEKKPINGDKILINYNMDLTHYVMRLSDLFYMIARDVWTTCEGDEKLFKQKLIEDKSLDETLSRIKFAYEFAAGNWRYQNDEIKKPKLEHPYQWVDGDVQNTTAYFYERIVALNPAFADKFPKVEKPIF